MDRNNDGQSASLSTRTGQAKNPAVLLHPSTGGSNGCRIQCGVTPGSSPMPRMNCARLSSATASMLQADNLDNSEMVAGKRASA